MVKSIQLGKKVILALILVFSISPFLSHTVAYGKENNTVYDAYKEQKAADGTQGNDQAVEINTSLVPSLLKFIFSFALIIILLLLVLRFLKSKSKQIYSQGPFYAMGGYSLGSNRSLQLVMIGKTLYILGIGNDVQLLRTVEPGEEQDLILQSLVDETERKQKPKLFSFKKKHTGERAEDWEQTFLAEMNQVKHSSFPLNKLKD